MPKTRGFRYETETKTVLAHCAGSGCTVFCNGQSFCHEKKSILPVTKNIAESE
jgi:hypothetical protein